MNFVVEIALCIVIIILLLFSGWCIYKYIIDKITMKKRRSVPYKHRLAILKKLLIDIGTSTKKHGVDLWLMYGSLLGTVRNNDFIDYDFDLDGCIRFEDMKIVREKVLPELRKLGYKCVEHNFAILGVHRFAIFHKESTINFDIGTMRKATDDKGNKIIKMGVPGWFRGWFHGECMGNYPQEWVFPLKTSTLAGIEVQIPNQADKLLTCFYGRDYKTPNFICISNLFSY